MKTFLWQFTSADELEFVDEILLILRTTFPVHGFYCESPRSGDIILWMEDDREFTKVQWDRISAEKRGFVQGYLFAKNVIAY